MILKLVIGGLQEHQSVKTDGICTCLVSAMGQGGGYVPMVIEITNKKQETRNKKQETRNSNSNRFECQQSICNNYSKLYYSTNGSGNIQQEKRRFWNTCYVNYKKIFKLDVNIAKPILARDYKGFGSGLIPSNGVIEIE